MKTATRIMSEFEKSGHPLGRGINEDQAPELVSRLRERLTLQDSELDLTPRSLKALEDKLLALPFDQQPSALSASELVEFVREIAAYVGEVLLRHAGGRWESLGTLWGTRLVIEGDVTISTEGSQRVVPSVAFSLGNIAAAALDMASVGKRPILYQDYLSAKRKMVKERLFRIEAE